MKKTIKKIVPYLAAAAIFIAAALIYCSPVLKGKTLYAGDTQSFLSAVNEVREFTRQTGQSSFWTGSMFCGMPTYQIGGYSLPSTKLMQPVTKLVSGWGSRAVWAILFYFICFFVLLRSFGVDRWTSIAGALATGLSSYFLVIIAAGHDTKTMTIATSALTIGGYYLIFRGRRPVGAALVAVSVAAGFSRHPQMFYYFMMLVAVLWIAEFALAAKARKWKDLGISTAVFVLAVALGIGTGATNTIVNSEYVRETMRGGSSNLTSGEASAAPKKGLDAEYATQWSYGLDETMTILIPGFMGGATTVDVGTDSGLYKTLVSKGVSRSQARSFCANVPLYWGDQPFTSGNVYMGAVVCLLFLLGLILVKGPYKWALLAATLFSIALAWGHNFMPLTEAFLRWFPMYSKFRAVSSILVVAEVAMPLLGFLALKEIFSGNVSGQELRRALCISGGALGAITLFFALAGPSMFSFTSANDASWASQVPTWLYDSIIDERASLMRSDSLRSLFFIAAAAGLLWVYSVAPSRKALVVAGIGALCVLDLWPVDKRYFNDSNFVSKSEKTSDFAKMPWEEALSADPDPNFRVLNLTTSTFTDPRTSRYFKSIGGYNAAKLRRYQELIDEHLSKNEMPVLNMLNTKYVIIKDESGAVRPQYNPGAFGNAWFVDQVRYVSGGREESDALSQVDLRTTAVVDRSIAEGLRTGEGKIELESYAPNRLKYHSESEQGGLVVFSEIYYPYGWKVFVDGEPASHIRANYTLRAMEVPAGQHEIEFYFSPDSVKKGEALSIPCIVLMYLLIAGVVFLEVRKKWISAS